MMYGWGDGLGGVVWWIGMAFMMFFWLFVLVGIILLVVWLVRSSQNRGDSRTSAHSACDIARQRYARGEIGKDEFLEICRTVGG